MDGTTEGKSFGPAYGEFLTAGGGDVEALALAVPTDALSRPHARPSSSHSRARRRSSSARPRRRTG